ncbi:hypothetical protein L1987_53741 [Smallanthus sonchifolius]|uniref:Uncharacterized protein n=1 Tax=Smallanthus sonchifolius TaxID=185202 RepID=A0ACB9EXZ6_9ASTR|nr:hypothetical protein L1987_53741 [Smallanthus sonchifolius]
MSELQKKRNGGFWFREWDRVDVTHLSLSIGKHVLAVCALFVPNWRAFWVAVALSYLTGMGVTLGYHRLLTHRSFKVPKWLEYIIVYCGLQASQGMGEMLSNHFTFFVNSVCHTWGERPWNTRDTSTNNWWVALLSLGEGWHNNHHAFPSSACHGIEWWQLDLTWELIKFLEMVGLAKDVNLPTEAEKETMALCTN